MVKVNGIKNLFTGWKDPNLTRQGINEASEAGKQLNSLGINFDVMFTSDLIRAQETGRIILKEMNQKSIAIVKSQKLNERNYGDLAGLNKDDAREKWGEDGFILEDLWCSSTWWREFKKYCRESSTLL